MIPWIQQQPLSIFASHFTKVPPAKKEHLNKMLRREKGLEWLKTQKTKKQERI